MCSFPNDTQSWTAPTPSTCQNQIASFTQYSAPLPFTYSQQYMWIGTSSGWTYAPSLTFNFNKSGSNISSYVWDDDGNQFSTSSSPSYTFATCGDHDVTCTTTDPNGCITEDEQPIAVSSILCSQGEDPGGPGQERLAAPNSGPQNLHAFFYPKAVEPGRKKGKLLVSLSEEKEVTLRMIDLSGKAVWVDSFEGRAGIQEYRMDIPNIAPGMVWLEIKSGSLREIQKIIIK
ncbi:PKD domain-containing protein [bacterium]|nr:PKD domain-containing protein [bacterium]